MAKEQDTQPMSMDMNGNGNGEGVDVAKILQSAPQFKSIAVDKDDDLKYDLGHLCAFDHHSLDYHDANELKELTRDNVQLLFTKIFQLPTKVVEDGVLAQLPKPSTVLPRSLPIPAAKEPTRWEKFAAIKGIKKKSRKPQLVWDEDHKEYRRRYGYKRANNEEDQWLVPAPAPAHGDDGTSTKKEGHVDPFTQMRLDKKERLSKQGKKEKRNREEAGLAKARSQSTKGKKMKDDISRTFALVSRSTASLGRFDRRLPGEKEAPRMKGTRRVAGVGAAVPADFRAERDQSLALFDKMAAKEDKVNKIKATGQFMDQAQKAASKRNRDEALSGKFKSPKDKRRDAEQQEQKKRKK